MKEDFDKAERVLLSCTNVEQLRVAHRFVRLLKARYAWDASPVTPRMMASIGYRYGVLDGVFTTKAYELGVELPEALMPKKSPKDITP